MNIIRLNLIFKLILTILIVSVISYKDFEQKNLLFFVADIQTSTSSKDSISKSVRKLSRMTTHGSVERICT